MQVFHCKVRKGHLKNLITTLEQFGKLSGLKLNLSKSTFLRIGSLRKHKVLSALKITFTGHQYQQQRLELFFTTINCVW